MRSKRLFSIIAAITVSCSMFYVSNIVKAETLQEKVAVLQNRLWGLNRYQTNSEVVNSGWTSSEYAVIASGEDFADALCAAPLAQQYKAPILLTSKNTLSTESKEQLSKLKVKKVFIIGGDGAISDAVKSEIENMGIEVSRIYGQNRFETSVEVAKNLKNINGVVVTNGYGFADALSIAPVAAQKGMAILLTDKDDLPAVTKEFLTNKTFSESYIVGGTGVVDPNIESYMDKPIRLSGQSRYETNAAVLNRFADKFSYDKVYVASGENYPDALSASVLAASTSSPLILVGNTVDLSVMSSVKAERDKYNSVIVLGGTGAVPDSTESIIMSGDYVENKSYTFGTDTGTYTGYMVNNLPVGQGSFSSEDEATVGLSAVGEEQEGIKYTITGTWSDGHIEGRGTKTWETGKKYVGEFENDKENVEGTLTFPNGDKYIGEFKDGSMEGQGVYTWANGDVYTGNITQGTMDGQGTEVWANGTKYVGGFENNEPWGQGTMYWTTGQTWTGKFEWGKPVYQ